MLDIDNMHKVIGENVYVPGSAFFRDFQQNGKYTNPLLRNLILRQFVPILFTNQHLCQEWSKFVKKPNLNVMS